MKKMLTLRNGLAAFLLNKTYLNTLKQTNKYFNSLQNSFIYLAPYTSKSLCNNLLKQSFSFSCLLNKNILVTSQNTNLTSLDQVRNYSTKKSKEKGNKPDKPKVQLTEDELESVINFQDLISDWKKSIERLKTDLNDNFSIRLTPSSFEQLVVNTKQGSKKLGELAQVEIKTANLYQIDMIHSPEYTKEVMQAIAKSNLNTNPQLDNTVIKIPIHKITRETREKMSINIKRRVEKTLSKLRDTESKGLRKAKEAKGVSSDLSFNVQQHLKYQFLLHQKEIHDIRDAKIKEILQE